MLERFLLIVSFAMSTFLFEAACLVAVSAETRAATSSDIERSQPHYQIVHIPLPKGYRIISAHYTKYGAVAGEIRNGQPTTNAPNMHGPSFAFVLSGGHFRTLRVPKDYATAEALDASKDGKIIIGNAGLVNNGAWLWENKTGVVWRNENPTTLSPLPGMGGNTDALKLRDNGMVTGYSWTIDRPNLDFPRPERTPCEWTPRDYQPVAIKEGGADSISFPRLIQGQDRDFIASAANKYGGVVGTLNKQNQNRAVLLKAGKLMNLNACLIHALPPGKFLVSAEDIDDRGWIIARLGETANLGFSQEEIVLLKPSNHHR